MKISVRNNIRLLVETLRLKGFQIADDQVSKREQEMADRDKQDSSAVFSGDRR